MELSELGAEISEALGDNHVSTMVYGDYTSLPYSVLVISRYFSIDTVNQLSHVMKKHNGSNIETLYTLVHDEIKGMGDSVPDELMDAILTYRVIAGEDVFSSELYVDMEHLRAQAEKSVRHYLFLLRWAIVNLYMSPPATIELFIKNLRLYLVMSGNLYYRLKGDDKAATSPNIIDMLVREFKAEKEMAALDNILKYGGESEEMASAALDVMDKVLKSMQGAIDDMGRLQITHTKA